jgi:hypothetical protein
MFQDVIIDFKILKEKQIFLFFSMSFGIFVSFQKKLNVFSFPNKRNGPGENPFWRKDGEMRVQEKTIQAIHT